MIVPDPPGPLPFVPLRERLYTQDELTVRTASGPTIDETIGDWYHGPGHGADFAIARALHDATIDVALAAHLVGRSVVGVMGGHADARGAAHYVTVARLGRTLSRAGYPWRPVVVPALMEAANLGAWFAPAPDAELDVAPRDPRRRAVYEHDPDAYVRRRAARSATAGRRAARASACPRGCTSTSRRARFATHIAKYFTNSIREDGLLAIARSGVVYTPGGAGTEQEIFTDTAQNSLNLYEVRSPMVFFGRDFHEREEPELVAARPTAGRRVRLGRSWCAWSTSVDEAVAFILAHDPERRGADPDESSRPAPAPYPVTDCGRCAWPRRRPSLADAVTRDPRGSRGARRRSRPTCSAEADAVAAAARRCPGRARLRRDTRESRS